MEGPFREPFYQCVTYEFYTGKESQFRAPSELTREQLYQQQYQPPQPVQSNLTRRQNFLRRAKFKSLRISIVIVLAFFMMHYFMMITFIFLNPDDQVSLVINYRT
jgi:hypothetical protein